MARRILSENHGLLSFDAQTSTTIRAQLKTIQIAFSHATGNRLQNDLIDHTFLIVLQINVDLAAIASRHKKSDMK